MARKKKTVDDATLIARFLRKNGVTECPMGQRRHSERQYKRAAYGETDLRKNYGRVHGGIDPAEVVTVVTDHAGREFYKNAAGEWL